MKRVIVSRNRYFDSVFLMQAARRMREQPGIRDASALLATDANKKVLVELGYGDDGRDVDFSAARPSDLVIAIDGDTATVETIAADPESWLHASPSTKGWQQHEPRSIREAMSTCPNANVAVISVPGEYAAREARSALECGLNVFLFSSNVAVVDELSLKTLASNKGLIVMGPDCGTAYIAGAGLGFANAVRRGPVGIVGSTGTGMQEFTSLVHRAGSGISHGIGVGSRDLSDEIGGITTFAALDALEADAQTRVIAIIAKPPGKFTKAKLLERCLRSSKPVVLCLLGGDLPQSQRSLFAAATIDEAVHNALEAAEVPAATNRLGADALRKLAMEVVENMSPEQHNVRGLFAGGTFCYQTQTIFRRAGLKANSNAPIPGMTMLLNPHKSVATTFVDMGAEIFVLGRPHPMIDATLRRKRLQEEAADASVALIILDFVLGSNAALDPVHDLLLQIREAMEGAHRRGTQLCFAASVCGTDSDAQNLSLQTQVLSEAGVHVFPSNAQAAAFAREIALLLATRNSEH